jgi:hypothetical protein
MDQWDDLRVGDHVRVRMGTPSIARRDLMVIVELRAADALGPDDDEMMAVVRDPEGELHTVPARRLEKH